MNIENIERHTLKNLARINILMGKNGCGKSTVMRLVVKGLNGKEGYGNIIYISPERGGTLTYDPSVASNISRSSQWLKQERAKNQVYGFKGQTIAQYTTLELLILREYEEDNRKQKFHFVIDKINNLLKNIQIKREGKTFKIYDKEGNEILPQQISSGESEIISLAIECLIFKKEKKNGAQNILFLDEPDVHLHPDLQVKLMHFLSDLVKDDDELKIIIATHSSAILGAFDNFKDTKCCQIRTSSSPSTIRIGVALNILDNG